MPPEARRPAGADDAELLVCIYYRVGAADAGRAIAAAREFQRELGRRFPGAQAEVLLRWVLPPRPLSSDALANPSSADPEPPSVDGTGTDATLMETYRLAASAAVAQTFLDEVGACAPALAGLLRSVRHVELFRPCA